MIEHLASRPPIDLIVVAGIAVAVIGWGLWLWTDPDRPRKRS